MVSHDFIGLLMLGLFNVSIGRQKIRADLSHDAAVSKLWCKSCVVSCTMLESCCNATALTSTTVPGFVMHTCHALRRSVGEVRSMTSIASQWAQQSDSK